MMNSAPDDSLDNLSILQNSKYKQLQAQIKQQFTSALQKLQSSETREIAIGELRKLIENYREPEHLRNYIAILKVLKPSTNSTTKEHEILAISILASTLKDQLLDPIDKPPSLLKTCFRLVEVLHGYFADHSPTVQQACARTLIDLSTYCLNNQTIDAIYQIIYSPLISILKSGVDKGSQSTASACLNELIIYNKKTNNQAMIEKISPDILAVILKVNCEYHQLFQAVCNMIQIRGLIFLDSKIVSLLAKILAVINGLRDSASTSNLNSYMCKVNVCKIIEKIGRLLSMKEKEKLADLTVIEALQQASRHRIMQVQLAASKALKSWKGQSQQQSPRTKGLASLQEKRNSKKLQRSKSKQKQKQDKNKLQLTFMKEDLQKLVKGGWGANNRAKNYVKRGSGVGGGFHGNMDSPSPSKSNGKSHKEHFEQLRQFIKKGSKENRHLDRFDSANPRPKEKSPQRSPVNQKKKSSKQEQYSGDQPMLEIDEGDQMISFSRPKETKSSQNRIFKQVGIRSQEAKQLYQNQKQLLQEGERMNINFNSSMSQQKKGPRSQGKDSFDSSYKNNKQNNNNQYNIPLVPNGQSKQRKYSEEPKRQENSKVSPKNSNQFVKFTEQEIGELVQEYNLSQVSDNLDGIINESDLQMLSNNNLSMGDLGVIAPQKGKSELESIMGIVADAKNRKSVVNKFFKKTNENQQSQIIEQSVVNLNPTVNTKLPTFQAYNNSLNLTQSLQSKVKSPTKYEDNIQFTLNPKSKFSSIKQQVNNNAQKQIQEQIVMSQYEESVPKGNLPVYNPRMPQSVQPTKQVQPEQKIDYQKLIKNPPRLQVPQNDKSHFKSNVRSEYQKSQISKEQQSSADLKQQWIKILAQLAHGEINTAFQMTLQLDDPIYLLRLMLITKSPLRSLTTQTIQNLWKKFMTIYSHHFIDVLTMSMFGQAQQLGLLNRCLSIEQMQQVLMGLYEISGTTKGKLSYKAASLYNTIEKSLHSD